MKTEIEVFQLQVDFKDYKKLLEQNVFNPEAVKLNKIGTITSEYPLDDVETVWDLCNYSCWGWNEDGEECDEAWKIEMSIKKCPRKAVIDNNRYKFTFTEYDKGYCNDDICFSFDGKWWVCLTSGWDCVSTREEAEKMLRKVSQASAGRYLREGPVKGKIMP